jgi:hypothetical protein
VASRIISITDTKNNIRTPVINMLVLLENKKVNRGTVGSILFNTAKYIYQAGIYFGIYFEEEFG